MAAWPLLPPAADAVAAGPLRWLERHERLLFALLLALVILPVWLFKYFPAWDSPLHLRMTDMMARYGEAGSEILTQYLVPNQTLEPNLAIYYILLFCSWFVDLYVAEKILLTLYAVLLALCGALRGGRDQPAGLGLQPAVHPDHLHDVHPHGAVQLLPQHRALPAGVRVLVPAARGDDAAHARRARRAQPGAGPGAPAGLRAADGHARPPSACSMPSMPRPGAQRSAAAAPP